MERTGSGRYEALDPALLPPLYIAYRTDLSESSEVFHNDIRARWERGEPDVVEAMRTWAGLADQVRDLLLRGEGRKIGPLLNANFDLRRRLYRISEGNIRLVETARSTGASAKFTGSGGAIVGTYDGEAMFKELCERLASFGAPVFRPVVVKSL
jgi:glucuronokinase